MFKWGYKSNSWSIDIMYQFLNVKLVNFNFIVAEAAITTNKNVHCFLNCIQIMCILSRYQWDMCILENTCHLIILFWYTINNLRNVNEFHLDKNVYLNIKCFKKFTMHYSKNYVFFLPILLETIFMCILYYYLYRTREYRREMNLEIQSWASFYCRKNPSRIVLSPTFMSWRKMI